MTIKEGQKEGIVRRYAFTCKVRDLTSKLDEASIKAQKELFNIVLENMTGKEYTKEQITKISDLME